MMKTNKQKSCIQGICHMDCHIAVNIAVSKANLLKKLRHVSAYTTVSKMICKGTVV